MFTGLVQSLATVVAVHDIPPGKRLVIESPLVADRSSIIGASVASADRLCIGASVSFADRVRIGASVAINGCCLTVVQIQDGRMEFEAGPETLRCTNLGELRPGSQVNLERSLAIGDELGGHFVTGHVDAVGIVSRREDEGDWVTLWIECPAELSVQMASKGSIAVDGVSLTLVNVSAGQFSVALIPHTLAVTTLGLRKPGDRVNLETDLLAKYVQRIRTPDLSSP
jgi:riboflavin synthase